MTSISLLAVPALLHPSAAKHASTTPAEQFATMYAIGRVTQPPATLLTSLAFFSLAYRHYYNPPFGKVVPANAVAEWKLWAAGGVAVLAALVPYTYVVLEPTSWRILQSAKWQGEQGLWSETEGGIATSAAVGNEKEEDEARNLIYRWGVLNLIRALLPTVGAGLGLYAVFS